MMLRLHKARLPIYALPIRRWCFIVILTAKYTTTRRFGERSSDSAYLCYSDGQWSEHYKWEEGIEAKSYIFFLCWSSRSHTHREGRWNYIKWVAQRWEGRRNRTRVLQSTSCSCQMWPALSTIELEMFHSPRARLALMPNTFILRVDIFHQLSVIKILILYPCRNQYSSFFCKSLMNRARFK